jgi:hypothetical protein
MEGWIMLKIFLPIGVASAIVAGVLATDGQSSASVTSTQEERFTDYTAPEGPELAASAAQERAVTVARVQAGATGALTLVTAHSNFAHAHALLTGQPVEESGPAERAEEMRSSVWVTEITAAPGEHFAPIAPTPRGRTGPSGKVLVLVADAHTGFIKEEYLGPAAPEIATLGPTVRASVTAESSTAQAATRLNPKIGYILGSERPTKVGMRVTIWRKGHRLETTTTIGGSRETKTGEFGFREVEGTYKLTANHCRPLTVRVHRRRTTTAVLHC